MKILFKGFSFYFFSLYEILRVVKIEFIFFFMGFTQIIVKNEMS